MTTPYQDDDETDISAEDEILLPEEDDGELSLEELEELEEESGTAHRVYTFNESDDGESYFDGAYFDE